MADTKTVKVSIPNPTFYTRQSKRDMATRFYYQSKLYNAFTNDTPFSKLISYYHGKDIVDAITFFYQMGGVYSDAAEIYLVKIATDYRMTAPVEMWLHWLEIDNLDKAMEVYYFIPMIFRFLSIVKVDDYQNVSCKCKELDDEFNHLCEEMGLSYKTKQDTPLIDYTDYINRMMNPNGSNNSTMLTITDIINGSCNCKDK